MNLGRKAKLRQILGSGFVNMGHRGARALAPENTLTSFQLAYKFTRYFELDTMICGSGELVVIHDESIDRTSSGVGLVADLSLKEIQSFDAGSFFSPEFKETQIPSLRQVLLEMPSDSIFDIEVKSAGIDKDRNLLARALVALISELKIESRVFISSFDSYLLEKVKIENSELLRGQLLDLEWDENLWTISEPDLILPNHKSVSKELLNNLKQRAFLIIPYTVNQTEDWARVIEAGVDGIITDRPDLLKNYLTNVD